MTRRVCMMMVANDFLPTLLPRLPPNVVVMGTQECFDRAATILRLEGPGLPDWCAEPHNAQPYVYAAGIIGGDGVLRLLPVNSTTASPKTFYDRIQEQHRNPN